MSDKYKKRNELINKINSIREIKDADLDKIGDCQCDPRVGCSPACAFQWKLYEIIDDFVQENINEPE